MAGIFDLGGRKAKDKFFIVRVPEEVPVRDGDGHVLTYQDGDTIEQEVGIFDGEGIPVLDRDGNQRTEVIRVDAPFGGIVTETKYRSFRVPLRGSLSVEELKLFRQSDNDDDPFAAIDAFIDLFSRYIPKKLIMQLSRDDINDLITAWDEASERADGVTQGES